MSYYLTLPPELCRNGHGRFVTWPVAWRWGGPLWSAYIGTLQTRGFSWIALSGGDTVGVVRAPRGTYPTPDDWFLSVQASGVRLRLSARPSALVPGATRVLVVHASATGPRHRRGPSAHGVIAVVRPNIELMAA